MNRRGFFKTLATAVAGFSILPAATTYTRAPWKKSAGSGIWIVNPEWLNAPYEVTFFVEDHRIIELYPIRYQDPRPGSFCVPPWIEYTPPRARVSKSHLEDGQLQASRLESVRTALDSPTERPIFALLAPRELPEPSA